MLMHAIITDQWLPRTPNNGSTGRIDKPGFRWPRLRFRTKTPTAVIVITYTWSYFLHQTDIQWAHWASRVVKYSAFNGRAHAQGSTPPGTNKSPCARTDNAELYTHEVRTQRLVGLLHNTWGVVYYIVG